MNKLIGLAGIAGAVLTIGGCTPAPLTKAEVDGRIVCNDVAMDQAQRQARRSNADIYWVHCPESVLRVVSVNDVPVR